MENGIRRIFYDKTTGEVLQEVGRGSGFFIPTIEQDISTYKTLSERNENTFEVMEIPYEQYVRDFSECMNYQVDIETKEIKFNYQSLEEEETVIFQKPLSVEIEEMKIQIEELKSALVESGSLPLTYGREIG